MKVEVGESLIRSWLRHVEGCEFAELNWKPSSTWSKEPNDTIQSLFDSSKNLWPGSISTNNLSQFLKQSEIDVLGYKQSLEDEPILHLVDIAFHSNGLNYGDAQTSAQKIYKKLVRSALLAMTYYSKADTNIYFITPFIRPGVLTAVSEAVNKARQVFEQETGITIELITGDDFFSRVLKEVLDLRSEVADTSEIFMRSWQLIAPFVDDYINPSTEEEINIDEIDVVDSEVNSEQVLISALYLSRFDHHRLNIGNQGETFDYLAGLLNINRNTLKNYRDRFDSHVDNHRVGWKVELTPKQKMVLGKYGEYPEEDLRNLLPSYQLTS
ncbi:hypothetical protein [Kangiella shandongensis]|uniref:hypothetical protein n=1 Tax=Kangiella shandongensis TaxID=2763258 RepID=UPI001CC05B26|nr:hypothetical protein [Kangiella shandongensis]